MKKICKCITALLGILLVCACSGKNEEEVSKRYVVLLGEEPEAVPGTADTDILVIDAEYYSEQDIATLKENGVKEIYTYLNIGSLENFRDYYEDYESMTLGEYENWPEERWVDVSRPEWQEFIAGRAAELAAKGIDGFFIDNTDVYYLYPEEEIYDGIVIILQKIERNKKKVIINGGDCFVSRYLEEWKELSKTVDTEKMSLFDGVNQESVYTFYDFDSEEFGINDSESREYATEYLEKVLENGFTAYALEYADNRDIALEAVKYSEEHGFIYYVSDNIGLKMNTE